MKTRKTTKVADPTRDIVRESIQEGDLDRPIKVF